jgi:hypothetical protein
MIKLFRKIRQNLLSEGKTSNYFKYAIGEIVLVVIGILIAVSLNDWSESRKQKQELQNIYSIISEDLKKDSIHITEMINQYLQRESIFNKILDGKMTKEEYENCEKCTKVIISYLDLTINKNGYNLLAKYNNNSNATIDILQQKIMQFYAKQLVELYADNSIIEEDLKSNYIDWKNNYPWYADFISNKNSDGFIEYALNSPDYKNRVANFYFLHLKIYMPYLKTLIKKLKLF